MILSIHSPRCQNGKLSRSIARAATRLRLSTAGRWRESTENNASSLCCCPNYVASAELKETVNGEWECYRDDFHRRISPDLWLASERPTMRVRSIQPHNSGDYFENSTLLRLRALHHSCQHLPCWGITSRCPSTLSHSCRRGLWLRLQLD